MSTNHGTNTAVTRTNENTRHGTAIEMPQRRNVESIDTGESERETTMTSLRGRKGTTVAVAVVVAYRGEKERETLTVNERGNVNSAIETTIGNQIHHVTDNNIIMIMSMFFFSLTAIILVFHGIVQSFNYCTYL